jgi:predicted ATP-grasp superfamily ATP-dependent carboligase
MKLFIYEHITSGALIDRALPPSLEHEGNLMLNAILNDFIQLTDIEITILRDVRLNQLELYSHNIQCHYINNQQDFNTYYSSALQSADFVLAIAPETDNILETIEANIAQSSTQSLGCSSNAIALCSDKYQCYQTLRKHQISTPHTITGYQWYSASFSSCSGYIVKPRDGAGCIDTLFYPTETALSNYLANSTADLNQLLIQPFIKGEVISLSLLCCKDQLVVLSINQQHILQSEQLAFSGSTVNAIDSSILSIDTATIVAKSIHQAIKRLQGFIGIDAVMTDNEIMIIDINPRLTTSYIGLHDSLQTNPAQLLITMLNNKVLPDIKHRHAIEVLL